MRSPLLALLLIVNLLTCPLRCMACESHAPASAESACATCDCCSTHCEETPASDDTEPQDDCSCTSCICEGAVVANPVVLPDTFAAKFWLLPLHRELSAQACATPFTEGKSFGPSGQTFSGRDARIARQSWQI